ncbi:MAG: ctaE [Gemmataceae bacterium]|nr:ctaE [Gemmataceae bacterium]
MSASTHSPVLKHHFDNLEQQHSAERLGMWMFLATEVLFFSGLFVAYTVYRYLYPADFEFASSHLILWIAGLNTGLLITSSLTMTFAIRAAQLGDRPALLRHLLATAALGSAFMGFKAYEYATDVEEKYVPGPMFQAEYDRAVEELTHAPKDHAESHPHNPAWDLAARNLGKTYGDPGFISPQRVQLFLCFYYVMTGIHGIHILVGIGCILWLVQQTYAGKIPPENYSTVEVVSLYWHLVDMIWLFLMPLLYLAGAGMKSH